MIFQSLFSLFDSSFDGLMGLSNMLTGTVNDASRLSGVRFSELQGQIGLDYAEFVRQLTHFDAAFGTHLFQLIAD